MAGAMELKQCKSSIGLIQQEVALPISSLKQRYAL